MHGARASSDAGNETVKKGYGWVTHRRRLLRCVNPPFRRIGTRLLQGAAGAAMDKEKVCEDKESSDVATITTVPEERAAADNQR